MKPIFLILILTAGLRAQDPMAPNYPANGIVNGASFTSGLSPNAIGSVFGTNLSWETRTLGAGDLSGGVMPTTLGNVRVYFGGWPAFLFYVSPLQINFLVPSVLLPGTYPFWVARQGLHGPMVDVTLQSASPAMFQMPDGMVIATHLDGSLVCADAPAGGGEIVSLWATGLGDTNPRLEPGFLPTEAQWLNLFDLFGIRINGVAIDASRILYAGVAPGYAGLYQVNVRLPDDLPANPEIRLAMGDFLSPPSLILPAR